MEDTRRSGLTLIELLVTLALVGLLAGIAVPAMGRFVDAARLRSAAEALSQELRWARSHALTHQQSVYFSVFISAEEWCYGWGTPPVCDCRADDRSSSACHSGRDDQQQPHHRLSEDFPAVELNTTRPAASRTLRFSPVRGTASADSFSLRNRAGELRVIVSPLGRVRICSNGQAGYPAC
jgi:type IV fimbrial biogenesis protein FimT